jgi:hypothetical protein
MILEAGFEEVVEEGDGDEGWGISRQTRHVRWAPRLSQPLEFVVHNCTVSLGLAILGVGVYDIPSPR